jgi:recombination protein RecA
MKRNISSENTASILIEQMHDRVQNIPNKENELLGNFKTMTSTGSTLLDLAISGGRVRGGGLPGGILVEVFGPNSCGKTALLLEIGGNIQHAGGETQYHDPEARLDNQFAMMFGHKIDSKQYWTPDKVPEVFSKVREWNPKKGVVNGIFADSLAALSTDLEMSKDEGDKMGGRRPKEFSEQLRKTCRIITKENYLMVCSNQIRETMNTWGPKYCAPGGMAMGFYSSLRLQGDNPEKIPEKHIINGKEVVRIIGVKTEFNVIKSSIWKPYHSATVCILFDYGIDDIRMNLQYLKDTLATTTYTVGGENLNVSLEKSIALVEKRGLVSQLKEEVIDLWEEVESKFNQIRIPKIR